MRHAQIHVKTGQCVWGKPTLASESAKSILPSFIPLVSGIWSKSLNLPGPYLLSVERGASYIAASSKILQVLSRCKKHSFHFFHTLTTIYNVLDSFF